MSNDILKQAFYFLFLVLSQVLIFNHILFLGYATPYIYIYFIIKLPVNINRNIVVLLGFLIGITIDMFCNTPGLNAAATTCIAFLRLPAQKLFFERDDFEYLVPKLSLLGMSFIKYVVIMILVHHTILISLESFSYFNIEAIVLRILLSSLLTFIIIFAFEGLSIKRAKV